MQVVLRFPSRIRRPENPVDRHFDPVSLRKITFFECLLPIAKSRFPAFALGLKRTIYPANPRLCTHACAHPLVLLATLLLLHLCPGGMPTCNAGLPTWIFRSHLSLVSEGCGHDSVQPSCRHSTRSVEGCGHESMQPSRRPHLLLHLSMPTATVIWVRNDRLCTPA